MKNSSVNCKIFRSPLMRCFQQKAFLFISFFILFNITGNGQTQTFTTTGAGQSFTVPAGVTSVNVQAWGGGGAGGGAVGGTTTRSGGGGAGGTYTNSTETVTPGTEYTVSVGAGGTGVSGGNGNAGGTSSFGALVSAVGGGGGTAGTGTARRGVGAAATVGITFDSGAGARAPANNQSGGGGGSAGTGSDGIGATGMTGGTAVPGGGAGANGRNTVGDGIAATTLGGGGSGAYTNNTTDRTGGAGYRGQVIVSWTCPTYSIDATSASSPVASGSASTITLSSSSLPSGTYTVTYNLSAPNTATGNTATMTFTAGSPGTGTFNTPALANGGNTTITITNLASGTGTGTGTLNCSNAISSNNTAVIRVSDTYYSRATGNWNSNTTWSYTSGGAAVGAGIYPEDGDVVIIEGGRTITVSANAACASITYNNAVDVANTITINNGISLTVSGAITIPRNATTINTLAVGAGTLNAGSIAFTNGGGTMRHRVTISTGTVTVTGNVTQAGSTGSATFTFTGAGLLQLGGSFLTATTGTLTPSTGTVEYNASGAQTAGNFTYNNLILSGSGAKTVTGVTVGGNLTVSGSATVTPAATMGVTGTTTLSGTSVLTLGAANILSSTPINLNGGTFRTGAAGGYNETVGTLNLSASSTIALGTGNHTLTFANSSAVGWTAGQTLTITGWTGAFGVSGTAGKVSFSNSSGLTSTQLSQIQFDIGGTYYPASILSTGEIVPGREPIAVVIIDNIVKPTSIAVSETADVTFDLHNLGPDATVDPVTWSFELPSTLDFVSSGSTPGISQAGNVLSYTYNSSMAVDATVPFTLRLTLSSSVTCPGSQMETVGAGDCGTITGRITISGGDELSSGYLHFQRWNSWATGGDEDDAAAGSMKNNFTASMDAPYSTCNGEIGYPTMAPDIDLYYDDEDDISDYDPLVFYDNPLPNRDRVTWAWTGILVPSVDGEYRFCGEYVDDSWSAWITSDFDPTKGQSFDRSTAKIIDEFNGWINGGAQIGATSNLKCGIPYWFRLIISSRNGCNDNAPGGYNSAGFGPTGSSTCTSNWDDFITQPLGFAIEMEFSCDSDGDGIDDAEDIDADNDGIRDTDEGSGDSDGDGVLNMYDLDSDNDGIYDHIEGGGNPAYDTNNDGIVDAALFVDENLNGLHDLYDMYCNNLTYSGNGKEVFSSNAGVTYPLRSRYTPDGLVARLNAFADYIVLELDEPVPAGNNISVVHRRYNAAGTATNFTVDQSTDGTTFTNPLPMGTGVNATFTSTNYAVSGATARYIRIYNNNATNLPEIDGLSFSFNEDRCLANDGDPSDTDSDGDLTLDAYELDSDNDNCNDVLEAGYTDGDSNGLLGNNPIAVSSQGVVTSGGSGNGYSTPSDRNSNSVYDFQETNQPAITSQPSNSSVCAGTNTSFSVTASNVTAYQWQVSPDNSSWSDVADNYPYSGATTATLSLTPATGGLFGNYYRVVLTNSYYVCGTTTSNSARLTLGGGCNVPPVANNDATSTSTDTNVSLIVTSNDTDADGINTATVDLDPATSGIQNSFTTADGQWSVNSSGQVTFDPNADACGVATTTYAVNDNTGISSNAATISITINDVVSPEITYNTSRDNLIIVLTNSESATEVAVNFESFDDGSGARNINPLGSDNCNLQSFSNDITGTTSGSGNYTLGENTLTWTATDDASHTTTSEQKVFAARENQFVLTCPADENLACNPTDFPKTNPTYTLPAWLSALIGNGTLTLDTLMTTPLGSPSGTECSVTRTRTYNVTFNIRLGGIIIASLTRSCTQTYTYIIDTEDPIFTTGCVANQTVNVNQPSGCVYELNGTGWDVVATDNCSTPTLSWELTGATTQTGSTTLNGVEFNGGTTTVTWTAVDDCGNDITCSFTVIVRTIDIAVTDQGSVPFDCPQLLSPFNANTNSYNAGRSEVSFRVDRSNSTQAWTIYYNFELTATPAKGGLVLDNVRGFDMSGDEIAPIDNTHFDIPASEDFITIRVLVNNEPGHALTITLTVDQVTSGGCNETVPDEDDNSDSYNLSIMPAIGSFN